jgi:hypothetical protein
MERQHRSGKERETDREISVTERESRDSDDIRDEKLVSLSGRILAKDLCTKLFNRISDIETDL